MKHNKPVINNGKYGLYTITHKETGDIGVVFDNEETDEQFDITTSFLSVLNGLFESYGKDIEGYNGVKQFVMYNPAIKKVMNMLLTLQDRSNDNNSTLN